MRKSLKIGQFYWNHMKYSAISTDTYQVTRWISITLTGISVLSRYFFLRAWLCERNSFSFGSLRCSRNEPDLKIFLVLYGGKMYPVQKRTENRPGSLFLVLLLPGGNFISECFRICYIRIFSFGTGLAPNSHDYMTFPVSSWLTYGSLMCTGEVWRSYPVYIGEPVRTPIIHFIIFTYRGVY